MPIINFNVGLVPNDHLGDTLREFAIGTNLNNQFFEANKANLLFGRLNPDELPGYVQLFATVSSFPVIGLAGFLYLDKSSNKLYYYDTIYKLVGGAVDSVNGKVGVVILTKSDIGLGNVDNTADAVKNVLSASRLTTARTINGIPFDGSANITIYDSTKEPIINAGANTQYWRGDKSWQILDKNAVGLGNVDNTADSTKNVLSASRLTTARNINGIPFDGTNSIVINAEDSTLRIPYSEKGVANGVATLDTNGLIFTTQLPSYVDDVLEFANLSSFPSVGESGKIYIAVDNNKTYRWSGSTYVYITSGAVDSVNGKTGVVVLNKSDVGLSNVDNTSDANKPISNATQAAINSREPIINSGSNSQYYRGDKTWQTLDKSAVGLGNVDNTADVNKPISNAAQIVLNGKATLSGSNSFTGSNHFATGISIGQSGGRTGLLASTVNAISIGDSDTGFRQIGDGILQMTANDIALFTANSGLLNIHVPIAGNISNSDFTNWLVGGYIGGGNEKPNNPLFGPGKMRLQMLSGSNLGIGNSWNDVLWASSYAGGDVKLSTALILSKDSDYVGFVKQNFDSASWGTPREILHSANHQNYSVPVSGYAERSGTLSLWSTDDSGTYYSRAIELREVNRLSNSVSAVQYAPALTFHWGGRSQNQIAMRGDSTLVIRGDAGEGNAILHAGNFSSYAMPQNDRTNWTGTSAINNVVGELAWRNFGNGHTIFDASSGIAPNGNAINMNDASIAWTQNYPSLMGWNGSQTFGVRVDSSRVSDTSYYASNATRLYAEGAPYNYYGTNPYYMTMNYNASSARWRLAVSPASPSDVEVSYANSSGYANSAGSAPNAGNENSYYSVSTGDGNGIRFWTSNSYGITMGVGSLYQYGPVQDYSIKMNMDDASQTRGFTWGRLSHAPIAALNSYTGDFKTAGLITANSFRPENYIYFDNQYGSSIVGAYNSVRYQGIYSMGDSFKLALDGTSLANHYGLAWTHSNIGDQSKPDLQHQLLVTMAGQTTTAIGAGIWTNGNITATGSIIAKAITQSTSDNSTNIATTAFVKSVIGNVNIGSAEQFITKTTSSTGNPNYNGYGFAGNTPNGVGIMFSTAADSAYGGHIGGETTSDNNMYFSNYLGAGTNRGFVFRNSIGSELFGIHPNGVRAIGDIIAYSASDKRLKDNVKAIENPIEKIKKIGGYSFDWNKNQDTHSGNDIGVIAQEIEEVLPQIVTTRDNGYKAVKYEKLVALLIEGMKEQQKEIDELKKLIKS